ncbi:MULTISPECIES: calcium-binding protein [unclassified Bradyrhizobium]|uniref:calcium-binding protein n=1 Tax=unclassified Bradyrhizobium TaxID=2631580 RepID=UPI0029163B51|nr:MULTISPECIES: calcium-binding protein [unclassified Bradyrhizobium]
MSKPILFIDTSYLASLSQLGDNLGAGILAKIGANYEIHITQAVLDELDASKSLAQSIVDWRNNTGNYKLDATPVTDSLIADGALTKNGADLSIYEAAKNYDGAKALMDDGFITKVSTGSAISDFINNKQASSYQNIKDTFSDIFDKAAISGRETSIDTIQKFQSELGLTDDALFGTIKDLAARVSGFTDQLADLARTVGGGPGSSALLDISGAEAVRAFGLALGALGLGLAAYDVLRSTQIAVAQYQNGDRDKALATEAGMLGRVLGGFYGAELGMGAGLVIAAALFPPGAIAELTILGAALVGAYFGVHAGELYLQAAQSLGRDIGTALGRVLSPLLTLLGDPLILDLNGDGVRTTSLAGSTVHFDYNGDGFAERTGWASPNDGILAIDANGNGQIDGGVELFGSPTQDGFAVLETLDANGDGVIDASDPAFAKLRIWRDLNQNGASDDGELQTLADAGIKSISLVRQAGSGTDAGNTIGYQALFTREDGTTGLAETVYFQTDKADTRADTTPGFTIAEGVDLLPLLPGSGTIYSIAYRATTDAEFRAAWITLTDQASSMTPTELRDALGSLLLRWAGVDTIDPQSRGEFVDARHLAFVEAFFGQPYREVRAGNELRTYPGSASAGAGIEASYENILAVLETAFLSQLTRSMVARGGDIGAAVSSPYFFYSMLELAPPAASDPQPDTPGNVGMVVDLITKAMPEHAGAAVTYLEQALLGLDGMVAIAFNGNRSAYANAVLPYLSDVSDNVLHEIAAHIIDGTTLVGALAAEGIVGTSGQDVFIGGGGGDVLSGGDGSDIYIYNKQDGDLWIKDDGAATDADRLVLTDINASDVTFDRIGDDLLMRVTSTGKTISVERFFGGQGIDIIRFADGNEWNRTQIQNASVYRGDGHNNAIYDSSSDDVIHGGKGDDFIRISGGDDTILYAKGDGYDVIDDWSDVRSENDKLLLTDLNPGDVELSRVGTHLILTVKSTGEYLDFDNFFLGDWTTSGRGIDEIKFADGTSWNRAQIQQNAWFRGTDRADIIGGSELNDTIEGGKGDDILEGGVGNDTFIWKRGDGNDQISDASPPSDVDTLWLTDVSANDVSYSYQGNTLLITIKPTGEIIRVADFLSGVTSLLTGEGARNVGIDQIRFQDGAVASRQEITYQAGAQYMGRNPVVWTNVVQGVITWQVFVDEFGHSGNIVGHGIDGINDIWNASSYGGYGGILGIPDALQPSPFHGGGNNVLNGNNGVDILAGGAGDDSLIGLLGNDILYGDYPDPNAPGGNDIIDGGGGNDTIYGGPGMDLIYGQEGDDYLSGGDGKDFMFGSTGNDTFVGGKGDDVLVSNDAFTSGSDTFIYASGDGNDTIYESGSTDAALETDVLALSDLASSDVEMSRSGNDLLVKIKSTGEIITVVGQFGYLFGSNFAVNGQGVETIRFIDGDWNRVKIQQAAWYRGTDGRDIIDGTNTLSQLDSTFVGGRGNDIIYGGRGSDTFVYASGDGNDIITDSTNNGGAPTAVDTLKFVDLNPADVELSRSGDDLLVKVRATGEVITVISQFNGSLTVSDPGLERIQFADGTSINRLQIQQQAWFRGTDGNDAITLSGMDDTVEGGKGNDIIYSGYQSGSGNDTFVYSRGDGNDIIREQSWPTFAPTEIDTLKFRDIDSSDISLRRSGQDLLINILSTNETITVLSQFDDSAGAPGNGLEYIQFANGDQWGRETIRSIAESNSPFIVGTRGNDHLVGSSVDQNLYGEAGDDTIDGQGGSDLLYGGVGNDTLVLSVSNTGDLVTVDGGVGTDTLDLSGFGAAVWVDLVTNGAEVRTTDQASLSTGVWRDMANVAAVENITGTAYSDELAGDAGNNVILGVAGDDVIDGRSGDDRLLGGDGNDVLTGGMGADLLDGGDGADVLNGGLGADVLIGGAGNDVLTGGTEGDIFVFGADSGSDTITDFVAGSGNAHDVIRFDRSVFASFAAVVAATQQVGADIVISLGGGGSITLQNVSLSDLTPDNFEFRRLDNQAPSGISVTGGTITENAAAGAVVATLSALDLGDNGSHTFSLADGAGPFEIVGNEIRVKDGGVIDFEQMNQYRLTVTATDDDGLSTTSVITINVADQVEAVVGTSGSDVLNGDAGADILIGAAGDDRLVGGAGSDEYRYQVGDGNDRIVDIGGASDSDKLVFGSGVDPASIVVGRSSFTTNDVVLLLPDGSTIVLEGQLTGAAETGVEKIAFADGTTWDRAVLEAKLVPGLLIGNQGTATLTGSGGDDVLLAAAGDRSLVGYGGSDTYRVGADAGNVLIQEGSESGTDRLEMLELNKGDVVFSRVGDDLVIRNRANGHTITVTGQFGATSAGIEVVAFANGESWNRSQIVENAPVRSTSTDGTVNGTAGDDVLEPGSGSQLIQGGAGSDTVIYALGDGSDTINDGANSPSQVDVLKLVDLNVSDLTFARQGNDFAINVVQSGEVITVKQQFGAATDFWGLEQIQFADGTVWNVDDIIISTWTHGTAGNDTVTGTSGNDVMAGLGGDDTLNGGAGDDTYMYRRGDGNDTIIEGAAVNSSSVDTLRLQKINPADVSLVRNGNDLTLVVAPSAFATDRGSILLKDELDDGSSRGVENIVFDDGTTWTQNDLRLKALDQSSTPGNDVIYGFNTNDVITGGRGDDTLLGAAGSDVYRYASGDGNDIIRDIGGANDTDTLLLTDLNRNQVALSRSLADQNDLLVTVIATGEVIAIDDHFVGTSTGIEKLQFADGTSLDRNAIANAAPLVIAGTSGSETLNGDNNPNMLMGLAGNDSLYGRDGNDILVGGTGNDYLEGGNGNDTYQFSLGDGQDTILDNGNTNDLDILSLGAGINSSNLLVTQANNGNDLLLSISGTTDTVLLKSQISGWGAWSGVDEVHFADGAIWDRATLIVQSTLSNGGNDTFYGDFNANLLSGGVGNDNLYGREGNDILAGGTGNDYLEGGNGNDTYQFDLGDGQDTILDNGSTGDLDILNLGAGINSGDVIVTQANNGNDLLLSVSGTTDTVLLKSELGGWGAWSGVDQINFADGTVWNRVTLVQRSMLANGGNDTFYGDFNANTLSGGVGNDNLYGRDGNDILAGGTGNDYLEGGNGNDTYQFNLGDGQDTILDNGSTGDLDVLNLGAGINSGDVIVTQANNGNDLLLSISGTTDTVLLKSELSGWGSWSGVDQINFSDGTVWNRVALVQRSMLANGGNDTFYGDFNANTLSGGAGNDNLYGRDGNDILAGGTGNDYLEGGNGNDTYQFNLGDGQDSILDNGSTGDLDILNLGAGINSGDVIVTQANNGNDLLLSISGTTDTVLLKSELSGWGAWSGVDEVHFADGTVWNRAALVVQSTLANGGNDTFYGDFNANSLSGGAGNDNLYGRDGNDILIGGAGNDYLEGGNGSDTYQFNVGDGQDTILDNGSGSASEVDTLALGSGISSAGITLSRANSGRDIVISFGSSTDQITLSGQLVSNSGGVDQIAFADGTVWNRTAIADASSTFTWVGSPSSPTMTGNNYGFNIFQMGAGAETANGGARGNAFQISQSSGQSTINLSTTAGSTNEVDFLGSITDQNLWFEQSGNDLKIDLLGTANSTTVKNWFSGSSSQLQEITAGGLKIDSQISQLVQVMASYSANNTGFDPTSSSIQSVPNDATLQNAIAASWHA